MLQREYQNLELEKDTLEVQVTIMEGEKKYFQDKILELESNKSMASKQARELRTRVKELEAQNREMEIQLKIANERNPDITSFCDQSFMIRKNIHQFQVSLVDEIYKVKLAKTRLKQITDDSLSFREGLLEVGKKVQIHLNWMEANSALLYSCLKRWLKA